MWVLSCVATVVGLYLVFRLSGIALKWVKEGLDQITPERYRK